jgi:dipeptidyl aminopeptidase/acylaminoacyl peptidase
MRRPRVPDSTGAPIPSAVHAHPRLMRVAPILLALAALPGAVAAQSPAPAAGGRAFALADWYKVTTLATPAVSPDGKRVAFTVTTVREAENKRHSEVWVAPLVGGGEPARYTSPSTESASPRWSPDGRYLYFASNRPGVKTTTWRLRMDAPGGEAEPVEDAPPSAWSRDGSVLVWGDTSSGAARDTSAARDPFAKMPPMSRPPFGAITRPTDAARFDGRQVVDFGYKSNDRGYVPNRREARRWNPSQLWVKAGQGAKRELTHTAYSHRGVTVSPDGRWIAFLADARLRSDSAVEAERDSLNRLAYDAKRDEADRNDVDLFVIPTAGGEPRRVADYAGAESDVEWSPDSKRIAFIGRPSRTKSARLYVVDATGPSAAAPTELLGTWPYEPDAIDWLPNGEIAMGATVGGRAALHLVSPTTKKMREVLGGRRRVFGASFDDAGSTVAYVSTDMTHPTELYAATPDGRNERRLTHFNDALNAQVAWSDAERFTYQGVGGLEIEGWLMKPYGYQPGKKYPLALYIHGGPHSQYNEGWFDEFQNLAAQGMWVLFTNPRGSSGYGADFTYTTRGRWGAEDYQDLMQAVDIAAKRADVDSTRMGVTGGSYGGFMTAWITTKTNRFKAAEADRMISEWTYWYGASDAQGLTEFEFYGKPWDNFAMYDSLSPIRHVTNVKTPTLIVQSEEDFRTPMGNAELWFVALRKQGVPAELVRYPRSTHELSRSGEPWLLVDRLGRLRQWFGYWLQDRKPATTAAAGADRQ